MPRLDFEKEFARQLKDRELKPSEGSWEKLQGRLEQKKSSSRYWWMGIAASIVGAVILFSFLGSDPVIMETPTVVDSPILQIEAPEPEVSSETVPLHKGRPLPEVTRKTYKTEDKGEMASAEPVKDKLPETQISDVRKTDLVSQEVSTGTEISDAELNALLEKAMAEVSKETGGETEVTDAEIDALLASARAAVRQEQALTATATLSPQQLLDEVETEIEHSFRAQVFEIIRDGLKKTRNAVANINE